MEKPRIFYFQKYTIYTHNVQFSANGKCESFNSLIFRGCHRGTSLTNDDIVIMFQVCSKDVNQYRCVIINLKMLVYFV